MRLTELFLYAPSVGPCQRLCPVCGNPMSLDPNDPHRITRDHMIPKSKGGSNGRRNIWGICWACNQERGDTPLPVFLRSKRGELA